MHLLWSCPLLWRHYKHDGVSNHQPHDCILKRLFRRRSKKASKHHVTVHCEGNSPVTGELPAQRASCAEYVSIWWRHHATSRKHNCSSCETVCIDILVMNYITLKASLSLTRVVKYPQVDSANKCQSIIRQSACAQCWRSIGHSEDTNVRGQSLFLHTG